MKFIIAPLIIVACLFLFCGADWGFGLSIFFLATYAFVLAIFVSLTKTRQKILEGRTSVNSINAANIATTESRAKHRHSFLYILFIANIIPTGFYAVCSFFDSNLIYAAPIWYSFATFFACAYWLMQK